MAAVSDLSLDVSGSNHPQALIDAAPEAMLWWISDQHAVRLPGSAQVAARLCPFDPFGEPFTVDARHVLAQCGRPCLDLAAVDWAPHQGLPDLAFLDELKAAGQVRLTAVWTSRAVDALSALSLYAWDAVVVPYGVARNSGYLDLFHRAESRGVEVIVRTDVPESRPELPLWADLKNGLPGYDVEDLAIRFALAPPAVSSVLVPVDSVACVRRLAALADRALPPDVELQVQRISLGLTASQGS